MQFHNHNDQVIYESIKDCLVNTKIKPDSISMFCPFCQVGGVRKNSKKWSDSQRKGYIIENRSKGYDHAIFYCQNTLCESRSLSTGSGGISLKTLANHIGGGQIGRGSKGSFSHAVRSRNLKPQRPCSSQAASTPSGSSTPCPFRPKKQVLPPSNRQQQSGLGAALDRKLQKRRKKKDYPFD